MEVSSQLGLLSGLVDGPFFDSRLILKKVIGRSLFLMQAADQKLGRANDGLIELVRTFSSAEQIFILRSTAIRYEIEWLQTNLDHHAKLDKLVDRIGSQLRLLRDEAKRAAFFQHGDILIQSYPATTIAWKPSNVTAENEASLVLDYYHQTFTSGSLSHTTLVAMESLELNQLLIAIRILGSIHVGIVRDIALNVRHFCKVEWEASALPPADAALPHGSSYRGFLGAFLGSTRSFGSMELLVETIFHETLHQKYFNTLFTDMIYREDLSLSYPAEFLCPWAHQGVDPSWTLDRVFAAFHVYVHLIVFYGVLYSDFPSMTEINPEWRNERLAVAHQKGIILMDWLDANLSQNLTSAGGSFYASLRSIFLRSIDLHENCSRQSFNDWEDEQGLANVLEQPYGLP